ncbi:MAG TPA: hypothetical protein VMJ75_31035 [Candidatus Acidoferrales bacterium]|nr:hypothetical protein [Candidatus Acidoferrales bacterium]
MTHRITWALVTLAVLVSASRSACAQAAAQRTMSTTPPGTTSSSGQPDAIDNLLRQYRTMWQRMSAAQQKAFVDSGGATPEQYERTLRSKGVPAVPASTQTPSPGRQAQNDPRATVDALDSLTTSLQDLNAIRDGNLVRVQKDGCPPEVTSRIADLRGRLRLDEAELAGEASAPGPAKERTNAADPMALAGDWYKQSPKAASRPPADSGDSKESKQLADVLSGVPAPAKHAPRIDAQRQKELEEEIARIQAEIAQLSGACATLKR